jgi:hypothetical protein
MFVITEVKFVEYYSNTIPIQIIEDCLIGAECNSAGLLTLKLEPFLKLTQQGPYLIPPIRWLSSFEECDEFTIVCSVKKAEDPDNGSNPS